MVNDPIADFLVRLQNASRVGHERVSVPYSRVKYSLATLLFKEGYVGGVEHKKDDYALSVELKYAAGKPSIMGTKRVSRPGRRTYMGVRDIHPVKRGHGILVLSTPAGILTDKEARRKRVGGEPLFEIW